MHAYIGELMCFSTNGIGGISACESLLYRFKFLYLFILYALSLH
jgi:hypothetical protein